MMNSEERGNAQTSFQKAPIHAYIKTSGNISHNKSLPTKLWKFEVDYNDHFETPRVAYQDIDPILSTIAQSLGKQKEELILYDPYYCQGNMVEHLKSLGYLRVINNNRDFYADIKRKNIPEYDVLLTNPPYSGDHKQRLLTFLSQSMNRPSLLLLPAYISTKSYWRSFVDDPNGNASKSSSSSSGGDLNRGNTEPRHAYLLPPDSYEYLHPEGTGKSQPPFYSAWFVSLPSSLAISSLAKLYEVSSSQSTSSLHPRKPCKLVNDVQEIVRLGYVTDKRPNPKARKRKLKQLQKQQSSTQANNSEHSHSAIEKPEFKKKKRF